MHFSKLSKSIVIATIVLILSQNSRAIYYVDNPELCSTRSLNRMDVTFLFPLERTTLYYFDENKSSICARMFPTGIELCGYPLPDGNQFACEGNPITLIITKVENIDSSTNSTSDCGYLVQNSTQNISQNTRIFYRGEECGYSVSRKMMQCPAGASFQNIGFICSSQPDSIEDISTLVYTNVGNIDGMELIIPTERLEMLKRTTMAITIHCKDDDDGDDALYEALDCVPRLSYLKMKK